MRLHIPIYQYKFLLIPYFNYYDVLIALSQSAFAFNGIYEYK